MTRPPLLASWNTHGFNNSDKAVCCKNLVTNFDLDLLFLLETRISNPLPHSPWFTSTHFVFPHEGSYDNFAYASPGRIWIKWNSLKVSFKPLFTSRQLIHGSVFSGTTEVYCISVVYASNSMDDRQILWKDLTDLVVGISIPWIILGDFNCCRSPHEKAGGSLLTNSKISDFNSLIFNIAVHDLSYVGHYFTWFNQRAKNPIHIKLDRMRVNDNWLDTYPNSFYIMDNPQISDHSPILLQYDQTQHQKHHFLFKNYWLSKPEFWDSLIQASPLDPELNLALKDIDHQLAEKNSDWSSWILQRAKAKWMSNGEDDLKFLYSRINTRHNSNLIKSITNSEGDFTISADINNVNVNHFQKIFNTNIPPSSSTWTAPIHLKLPSNLIPQLVSPITVEEIKNVVFSSPKCSTPGPDGYTFEFYKSTWNTIGKQLCKAVLTFFSTGSMPKHAKATAIALIPKRPHAQDIADYRPISPCNNFYKIIAKILANRMKEVMPSIIHPSQSGFNKDRVISDNILLVAELLKDFNSSSKNQYFCVKFDIHKAFDTVSRNFLIDRMLAKGFPYAFVSWIKGCISDVYFSVSINGALDGYFKSSSGLRQGCPLSPTYFALSWIASSCFEEATLQNSFKGMKAGNISISHLLYADDLLVFAKDSLDNAHYLNNFLNNFASISSLQVNSNKINILLSKNVTNDEAIYSTLNIPISTAPVKYLGILIFHRRLKICDYQPLLEKISGSLDGWKARNLSFVGRLQYHNYTINNILAYWSVADRLKQANLEFLITSTNLAVSSHINNGCWNLPPNFPTHLAAMINSVPICNSSDECCWTKPAKPSFRNFIKLFYEEFEVVPWYKFVWHKHYSLRFSIYSWFAFKNWLKTVDALTARGIPDSPHCVFCKSGRETKNHLLFECDFTFNILKCFLPRMNSMLMRPNLGQIFNDMDDLETDCNRKNFCFLLIYAIVYYTWRARNDRLFGNNIECLTTITSKIKKVCWCPWTASFGNHGLDEFLKDNDDGNLFLLPLDGLRLFFLFGNQGSPTIRLDDFGSLGDLQDDCLLSP
ncbi:uncharacterized protein LOC110097948 [Dendrobium catenatum]|uniref:uncharacterized protein LOC110097948 n=1 Tax=Dendrobium catenatum TaxID=906689 RepID=UPI0009F4570D|nr:uncharacterized protein LOC110097948 [Dendrobium catenatum]